MATNALHKAIRNRDRSSRVSRLEEALFSGNHDVNERDDGLGWTPLHFVVASGIHHEGDSRYIMAFRLLEAGADPHILGKAKGNPVQKNGSPLDFVEINAVHTEGTAGLPQKDWKSILHLLNTHPGKPVPRRREAVLATKEKYK